MKKTLSLLLTLSFLFVFSMGCCTQQAMSAANRAETAAKKAEAAADKASGSAKQQKKAFELQQKK